MKAVHTKERRKMKPKLSYIRQLANKTTNEIRRDIWALQRYADVPDTSHNSIKASAQACLNRLHNGITKLQRFEEEQRKAVSKW